MQGTNNYNFLKFQSRVNARFVGNDGSANHALPPMFYSHTGGAGGAVGDKFLIAAGKGFNGKLIIRNYYWFLLEKHSTKFKT